MAMAKEVLITNARNDRRGRGLRVEPAMTEGESAMTKGSRRGEYARNDDSLTKG